MSMYAFLADVVVAVHLAVVIFMVAGLPIVLLGGALGWQWVRNPWFRLIHLGIMAYIAVNALRGELCFLTHWEADLRRAAGQGPEEGSFLGRLLHGILFVEADQDLLNGIYVVFAVVVVLSWVLVRPQLRDPRDS